MALYLGSNKKSKANVLKVDGYTKGYEKGFEDGKAEGGNTEEAYNKGVEEGKLELLQDSEYMNAKVSGTAIAVNDVSPIEHSVGCKVASKNLFNAFETANSGGGNAFDTFEQSEGCVTVTSDNSTARSVSFNLLNAYLQKGNYILSFDIECENSVTTSGNCDCIYVWHNDVFNTARSLKNDGQNGSIVYKFTLTETTKVNISWYKSASGYVTNNTIYKAILSNIQLELGTTATEYTPYVADVGGIEVSQLGKNLALAKDVYKDFSLFSVVEFEGRTAVRFLDNRGVRWTGISFKPNTQYTVSFDARITPREDTATNPSALLYIYYSDGTYISLEGYRNTEWEHFTITSTAGKTVVALGMNSYGFYNFPYIDCNSFQLEEGSTATAYEPYNRTTYQSTTDGTVDGIKSISPNMTLLTNNNGVVINANYLRDIDTYIDNLSINVALTGGEA